MAERPRPPEEWRTEAEVRVASLAKPPGALGTLEEWYITLCVAQETLRSAVSADALVFVADHGCKKADAALSPYPASAMQPSCRSRALREHRCRSHCRPCPLSWAEARRGARSRRPHQRKRSARGSTTTRSWTSKYWHKFF